MTPSDYNFTEARPTSLGLIAPYKKERLNGVQTSKTCHEPEPALRKPEHKARARVPTSTIPRRTTVRTRVVVVLKAVTIPHKRDDNDLDSSNHKSNKRINKHFVKTRHRALGRNRTKALKDIFFRLLGLVFNSTLAIFTVLFLLHWLLFLRELQFTILTRIPVNFVVEAVSCHSSHMTAAATRAS